MPWMRRRIRSAAFPVHRHSVPQLVVDAGLVALAYWLAYRLRFDRGVPDRYDRLLDATILWAVVGSPLVFSIFGLYQKWWRYLNARDYEQVLKGVVVSVLALVGAIALIKPVELSSDSGRVAVSIPTGVIALYFLLSLALLCGARFLVRVVLERRIQGFRPRIDARDVLIVGAGDGGQLLLREIVRNPALGYRPIGFLDDDPRKKGMRLANGLRVLGHDNRARSHRRGDRPRGGPHRDPLGAGNPSLAGGDGLPGARDPRPHAADRLRAVARRRRERAAPGARGARRGRARARAGAHGARPRRHLPRGPGR